MADVPWESEESRNYICMQNIVTDVVSGGLKNVFKREWNSRYLNAWDDTSASGAQLFHSEKARKRPNMKDYQKKFQHGNTNQWDCSTLFDAILYSNSIGATLNPIIKTEVDKLRIIRNNIMHPPGKPRLTDSSDSPLLPYTFHARRVFLSRRVYAAWKVYAIFRVPHPPSFTNP